MEMIEPDDDMEPTEIQLKAWRDKQLARAQAYHDALLVAESTKSAPLLRLPAKGTRSVRLPDDAETWDWYELESQYDALREWAHKAL